MMKFVNISALAMLPFWLSANTVERSVPFMINNCLSLHSVLAEAFIGQEGIKTKEGEPVNKASFHYQSLGKGFKGICSNAQFFIENNGLKSTMEKQKYVFMWSSHLHVEDTALSIDNIKYTLQEPKNIKAWLKTEF